MAVVVTDPFTFDQKMKQTEIPPHSIRIFGIILTWENKNNKKASVSIFDNGK